MRREREHLSANDPQLAELEEAARRAGEKFSHHVGEITMEAERRGTAVVRQAENDADATRREAVDSGQRVFDRISALERPLGELVRTLRHEMSRVNGELEEGKGAQSHEPR